MHPFITNIPKCGIDCALPSVLKSIARSSKLTCTQNALEHICSTPITDVNALRARQKDIIHLRKHSSHADAAISAKGENDFKWLIDYENDPETKELLEIPYFNSLLSSWMNHVWPALGTNNVYGMIISPLACVLSPIIYLLSPLFFLWYKLGIKIGVSDFLKLMYHSFMLGSDIAALAAGRTASVTTILVSIAASIFVYVQSLRTTFRHAQNLYNVCKKICDHLFAADTFVRSAKSVLQANMWSLEHTKRWLSIPEQEICESPLFPNKPILSYTFWDPRIGKSLLWFRKLRRWEMMAFIRHVSMYEAVRCVSATLCETKLVSYGGPGFAAKGLVHPCVSKCVGNNVVLATGKPGIVLTGPNASGKSTILRSIGLASIMSQTLGVAYCEAIAIIPVLKTYTHMCIPDSMLGGKSRFQAEMQSIAQMISDSESGQSCLMIVDEIFSSTNACQGVVCLDSVLKRMSSASQCMFILATHHAITFTGVKHLRMKCRETQKGKTESTYILADGKNDVNNAVELLNTVL